MSDSTSSIPLVKICKRCQIEKPVTEFYLIHKRTNQYQTNCKQCYSELAATRPRYKRTEAGIPYEQSIIKRLTTLGIPALPGKAMGHKWADIVAWGIVTIEAKSALNRSGQYNFRFSEGQRTHLRGHLVLLVCKDATPTYHLFRSNHPMFYLPDGRLKTGLSYTPDYKHGHLAPVLTPPMMKQAKDDWQLINIVRDELCESLRLGKRQID